MQQIYAISYIKTKLLQKSLLTKIDVFNYFALGSTQFYPSKTLQKTRFPKGKSQKKRHQHEINGAVQKGENYFQKLTLWQFLLFGVFFLGKPLLYICLLVDLQGSIECSNSQFSLGKQVFQQDPILQFSPRFPYFLW